MPTNTRSYSSGLPNPNHLFSTTQPSLFHCLQHYSTTAPLQQQYKSFYTGLQQSSLFLSTAPPHPSAGHHDPLSQHQLQPRTLFRIISSSVGLSCESDHHHHHHLHHHHLLGYNPAPQAPSPPSHSHWIPLITTDI
ncbi:hypothetical protein E2C01_096918 [Portunus trituberculatus]|uniref:Uncharacterized protein n=1 Tax=Portunus trituberculatus TaxID=210409 RepID=A0A5B7JZ27_PORTR|nr:hypothetical protein [Portunus trituberculatus]